MANMARRIPVGIRCSRRSRGRVPEPMTFTKNVGGKNTDEGGEEKAQNLGVQNKNRLIGPFITVLSSKIPLRKQWL
jgi:hypothetical protein